MNDTDIYQLLWILLACGNFSVQLMYFFHDQSSGLYTTKKVTTPLLLFGGLLVVVAGTGGFPLIPGAILLVMGLGELGIEGSRVVEPGSPGEEPGKFAPWTVTTAGILFLLVNLFIGVTLLIRAESRQSLYLGISIGFTAVVIMAISIFRLCSPPADTRLQLIVYSTGLAVLTAGVVSNLLGGWGILGRAALVLAVSDSLVLIRMGAAWEKNSRIGRGLLLSFLVTILLLYYLFIAMLVGIAVPF